MQYARERGQTRMENIVWGKSRQFWELGRSMDKIGWRRFMEGMISGKVTVVQKKFVAAGGGNRSDTGPSPTNKHTFSTTISSQKPGIVPKS